MPGSASGYFRRRAAAERGKRLPRAVVVPPMGKKKKRRRAAPVHVTAVVEVSLRHEFAVWRGGAVPGLFPWLLSPVPRLVARAPSVRRSTSSLRSDARLKVPAAERGSTVHAPMRVIRSPVDRRRRQDVAGARDPGAAPRPRPAALGVPLGRPPGEHRPCRARCRARPPEATLAAARNEGLATVVLHTPPRTEDRGPRDAARAAWWSSRAGGR